MNDPIVMLKRLNPGSNLELAQEAPARMYAAPEVSSKPPSGRSRGWKILGTFLVAATLAGIGGTAVATNHEEVFVDPDFSANGPLITERIAPLGARWADPGEPELNLQSPLIHNVFAEETAKIPLPPGASHQKVYGQWIADLTSPGMTQHTRTEIRAEANREALGAWFRYWLSATRAERKQTASAMQQVVASPYLNRSGGEIYIPFAFETEQVQRALDAAKAGDTTLMRRWAKPRR